MIYVLYVIQTLTTLILGNNRIGDAGAQYILNALKTNKVNHSIYFTIIIFIFLLTIQTLSTLDLKHNRIGPAAASNLAQALKDNEVINMALKFFIEKIDFNIDSSRT